MQDGGQQARGGATFMMGSWLPATSTQQTPFLRAGPPRTLLLTDALFISELVHAAATHPRHSFPCHPLLFMKAWASGV